MRLIGMSTGSALPDCSPARIGPCDSLWMFLVTTTTRMILKSWKMQIGSADRTLRFLVDVLSDDNYENDFEIVENAYAPPQVVGQPVILGPGLTIKRGDCQARSAEDLVNPAIRNLFEEDPPDHFRSIE